MGKKLIDKQAPDFTLNDVTGKQVRLSDYRGTKNVVLVFNRSLLTVLPQAYGAVAPRLPGVRR